jgi:hypothetical protein
VDGGACAEASRCNMFPPKQIESCFHAVPTQKHIDASGKINNLTNAVNQFSPLNRFVSVALV